MDPAQDARQGAEDELDLDGKAIWLHGLPGKADVTIIDCEQSHRGIICDSGETPDTIIDGFTITNCSASWYDWNENNQIEYWEYFGGGMWNRDGSSPTVRNCVFSNNRAEYGGGIYNGDENGVASAPTIVGRALEGMATSRG